MVKLYIEAKKFILRQRIEELTRAISHWPLSDKLEIRTQERLKLIQELEKLNGN